MKIVRKYIKEMLTDIERGRDKIFTKRDAIHNLDVVLCNSIDMKERREAREWQIRLKKEIEELI